MSYKDMLVVVDAEPRSSERIAIAARLAERFGAHLACLYVNAAPVPANRHGYYDPALLDATFREDSERDRNAEARIRQVFEDEVRRQGISGEWRLSSGYPSEYAALHGRYADLIILGQLDPENLRAPLIRPRPEDVALMAGRPVLVIPYVGSYARIGERVLVGWDASREATRAVADAMPLLAGASEVTVMTVDAEASREGHGQVPGADIALHLARHGVAARVEHAVSVGIGGGNTLLSRASDLEADLLVMGAYAHSRVRELLLGGTTQTVLESMTLPVLMAH